jgi:hypothetical protein
VEEEGSVLEDEEASVPEAAVVFIAVVDDSTLSKIKTASV